MISRRTLWGVAGLVLLLGGVGVLLLLPAAAPDPQKSAVERGSGSRSGLGATEPEPPAAPVAEEPREVPDPWGGARRPADRESALRSLSSRLAAVRFEALRAIVERGLAGEPGAVRERLASLESSEDRSEALWAKGALSRLDGDRARLVEIARRAVATPEWRDPGQIVRALDPDAEALLRALELAARLARDDVPREPAGLVEAFVTGRKAASAVVAVALATTPQGEDLEAWVRVASGFRPTPDDVVTALTTRAAGGDPDSIRTALRFLAWHEVRLSEPPAGVERFLRERMALGLEKGRTVDAPLSLFGAVGKLPRLDPETARAMTAWLEQGNGAVTLTILATLAAMGPRGAAAASDVVAWAETARPTERLPAVQALAAIGTPEVVAHAARRLAEAPEDEKRLWLRTLSGSPNPTPLWAPLQRLAEGDDAELAVLAVGAAARVDPAGGAEGRSLLLRAGEDRRPEVRSAAVTAVGAATVVHGDLWRALVERLGDRDPSVRRAAAQAAATAAERAAEGADLVTPLVPLLADPASPLDPAVRRAALHALAVRAPTAPVARGALLDAVERPGAPVEEREAALWGLGRTRAPTPAERDGVRRAGESDVRLRELAEKILAQPGWKTP